CGRAGLDWLLVDLEHGAGGDGDLLAMLQAIAGTGTAAIVRVEQGTRLRVGRALDLGAEGNMVPRIDTVEEAREICSSLRYPPAGIRGVALFTRGLDWGGGGHAAPAKRNDQIVGIVQIESVASVEAANELASLDEVDVLFVGPADLSHALGNPGDIEHPDYLAAIEKVGRAAKAHGKAAGVLLWKPEDVDRYVAAGYTFFSVSSEGALLLGAVRGEAAAVRERAPTGR
ncbi:MAG: aldolase/citrate lyase family protein, partial [Chloroflexota bacterium]|nr:aldolase/citrate lyase family protein [Chloroflexota bacterium]